ncbi:MAG: prepilin-type N-terminal cleavage/methylation domain-containing protein [Desulfobacterales bacterium]|nr:prepilin-type N-terminal cleavage/methylation domain-containing protein [Desulfobacterales bacterium]
MLRDANKGFTLLELLISLTILGVIVVIIFGAFRIGIRAWEKGEKDVESRQRQRIVLDLIKRQLASTCLREVKDANQQALLLKGDNKSIEFVSYIPMVPGNQFGTVYVKYMVEPEDGGEGEQLVFWEKNIVLLNKETDMNDLHEDDFFELFPGVQSVAFEYLKGRTDEETSEWQQTWDQTIDEGFPRAIRVILMEDVESAPIYVIARIELEAD